GHIESIGQLFLGLDSLKGKKKNSPSDR
ncbi:MAG: RNA methyltransferase, partial [Microcystis aeruginosa]